MLNALVAQISENINHKVSLTDRELKLLKIADTFVHEKALVQVGTAFANCRLEIILRLRLKALRNKQISFFAICESKPPKVTTNATVARKSRMQI